MIKHTFKHTSRLAAYTALFALSAPLLTGCIAEDIRKELVSANQQLTITNETMRKLSQEQIPVTQELIADVRVRLDDTKVLLAGVQTELQQTNTTMVALQSQLKRMDTIDASLMRLDVHLASLRETLQKIDETIPFLSLSATTQPTTQPTTLPTTPDAPTAPTAPTAPASK
jgi:hypothetical protein